MQYLRRKSAGASTHAAVQGLQETGRDNTCRESPIPGRGTEPGSRAKAACDVAKSSSDWLIARRAPVSALSSYMTLRSRPANLHQSQAPGVCGYDLIQGGPLKDIATPTQALTIA